MKEHSSEDQEAAHVCISLISFSELYGRALLANLYGWIDKLEEKKTVSKTAW